MFLAAHPRHWSPNEDGDGAEVHPAPEPLAADIVVHAAAAAADWAPPFAPLVDADMDLQRPRQSPVLAEFIAENACALDVEQMF